MSTRPSSLATVVDPAELIGFRNGDPDAVRAVYRAYSALVFTVAYRTLGSRDLAEEVTQETFVKAWRAAASFDPARQLGPWLARIARHTAIDLYRREAPRRAEPFDDATVAERVDAENTIFDVGALLEAIDKLPPLEREVVRLQHLESLTYAQIGLRVGVPVGTIKSRSFRAHRRLAARLGHLRGGGQRTAVPARNRATAASRQRSSGDVLHGEPLSRGDGVDSLHGELILVGEPVVGEVQVDPGRPERAGAGLGLDRFERCGPRAAE